MPLPVEHISDAELRSLIAEYTREEGHHTNHTRRLWLALNELKWRRPCEHGPPRQFCTGAHNDD